MKITAITAQVKTKGRYSVFVDDKYAFSFSEQGLMDHGVRIGLELDEHAVKSYKKLSADDKAYGLTLGYLARRARSEWELSDYFKRKGYDPELGEQIIDKVRGYGYVNDKKFAESWVANRRQLKSMSKRKLIAELRAKHVASSIIDEVLLEDETDEQDMLREQVAKKRRLTKYQDSQKLMQYLAGQGFSYEDIKTVLAEELD
jgi:regulatory protein